MRRTLVPSLLVGGLALLLPGGASAQAPRSYPLESTRPRVKGQPVCFHIASDLSKAIDEVRAKEAKELRARGLSRWLFADSILIEVERGVFPTLPYTVSTHRFRRRAVSCISIGP
jgi:hypothetical protein